MRRQWQWFVLAALVLLGCGGSDQVGSVEAVLSPVALVNDSAAGAGDGIPSGATLSTNKSGVLEFLLQGFSTTCQLRPESQIVVQASQGSTVLYQRGGVWCQASAAPQQEFVIDVGVRQLRVKQARFGLRDGQVVVDSGEVTVSGADGAADQETGAPDKDGDGAPRRVIDEGQACDIESHQVRCWRYTPNPEERSYLESVEMSHNKNFRSSDGSSTSETEVTPSETEVTLSETEVTPSETEATSRDASDDRTTG